MATRSSAKKRHKKRATVRSETLVEWQGYLDRRGYSGTRLASMENSLAKLRSLRNFPETCIYVTGSYARLEAGRFSDIDLFFIQKGSSAKAKSSHLNQVQLFSDIISMTKKDGFPPFSNDGEYLKILYIDDMLEGLGGPEDDYKNHFTARMLLLLESHPLVHPHIYKVALKKIVDAYFRDYPDHTSDFKPTFLINDILRFWKTLCLNYENKRNRPDADLVRKRRQQVKNFKLKYSRMLTCFGTVAAICALKAPVTPRKVLNVLQRPPLERLFNVLDRRPEFAETAERIVEEYLWFLQQTALSTDTITRRFGSAAQRRELFRRADMFGDLVFEVLRALTGNKNYLRYLVI